MKNGPIFLIVDDDVDDVEFACAAIKEIFPDSICLSTDNGMDCLRLLHHQDINLPDIIFLDLNMPQMDGKACLAELKKDDKLKDIPIIIHTTSSSQCDRDETRQLGAAYYLVKRTSFKGICDGIRGAIQAVSIGPGS